MNDTSTSRSGSRWGAWFSPLLLLFLVWRICGIPDAAVEGEVAEKGRKVLESEAELAAHAPPEVVVMGNSASFHGVDADALGKAFDASGKVAKIYVPASRTPAWYALLKHRVLGNGYKPKLVVVVASHHHMVDPETTEDQAQLLKEQVTEPDALIDEKVFGTNAWSGPWTELRARAAAWFEWPKDVAVGWLLGDPKQEGLAAAGRRQGDEALARLFDLEHGTDLSLHQRILPVAAVDREAGAALAEQTEFDPEASMLADVAALAEENGIRIVFVSFPMPSSNHAPRPGVQTQQATIALLNRYDAGWLDLSRVPLPDAAFFDHIHLNAGGRRQFTEALVQALLRLDPLNPAGMPDGLMPLVASSVTREGDPTPPPPPPAPRPQRDCQFLLPMPALEAYANKTLYDRFGLADASPLRAWIGDTALLPHVKGEAQACDGSFVHGHTGVLVSPKGGSLEGVELRLGWDPAFPSTMKERNQPADAYWVYPGTVVTLSFDEAWDPARGAFGVSVDGLAVGGPGPWTVEVGQDQFALEMVGGKPKGTAVLPAPTGPWTIRIRAAPTGGALLLRNVSVGDGAFATPVLGRGGGRASLRILGGPFPDRTIAAASAPPALGIPADIKPDKEVEPHPKARIKLGAYAALAPKSVREASQIGGCSPLWLAENGVPLGNPLQPVDLVKNVGRGAVALQTDAFFFTASDNTDPATNGRAYLAYLDPRRSCAQAAWVYPGDAVTVAVPKLGSLPADLGVLELAATPLVTEPGDTAANVHAEVDGVVVYDGSVRIRDLSPLIQLPLVQPIRAGAQAFSLTLTTPSGAPYLLVTGLGLTEADEALAKAQASLPGVGGQAIGDAAGGGLAGKMVFDVTTLRIDPKNLLQPVYFETNPGDGAVVPFQGPSGPGLRLTSTVAAATRICPGRFHVDGAATARLHVRPVRVQGNKQQTLRVDATYFTADGPPLKRDDGKPFQDVALLPAAADWQWVEVPLAPPSAAATAQMCLRFAASTGEVEIDGWEVVGAVRK